jgi:hypothetical protein
MPPIWQRIWRFSSPSSHRRRRYLFRLFSYFFVVLLRGTDNLHVRYQEGKNKKREGSQQQSSTLLRFREMPSVCVGSGKKLK